MDPTPIPEPTPEKPPCADMVKPVRLCNPPAISRVLPAAFDESLSYLELLLNFLHKLNETIDQVNENTEQIEIHRKKINEIIERIKTLKDEILKIMNQKFGELEKKLNQKINKALQEITDAVNEEFANFQNTINIKIEALQKEIINIQKELETIEIHANVMIRNPITGEIDNVEDVCEDLFELHRTDGLTAQEYDDLEKTADEYIAYDMTAYQYAMQAKTIMI